MAWADQRMGGQSARRRWWCQLGAWLLGVCLLALAPWASGAPLGPMDQMDQIDLQGRLELLVDDTGTLSLEQVRGPEQRARFTPWSGHRSLGYQTGAVWLRLTLSRPAQADAIWWLDLGGPWLDEAQLFEPLPDGSYHARAAVGAKHPFAHRDVNYRSPVYRLALTSEPQPYYLRLQGDKTMLLSLRLWSPPGFVQHYAEEQLALGMLVGAHLLLCLSAIWFGVANREQAYHFMALAIAANLVHLLASEGLAYQWLTTGWPGSTDVLMVLGWYSVLPFCSLFVLHYARLWQSGHWVWAYLGLSWGVSLVAMPWSLYGHFREGTQLMQLWTLLLMGWNLALSWHYGRRGNQRAVTLGYAFAALWLGLLVRVGRNMGWVPDNVLTNDGYHLGFFMFMVVIKYGVIRHFKQMRQQIEQTQRERWQRSRKAEQRVEAEVRSRTAQLNEALEMVQRTLAVERRAREDQRQFFATVSHELRTPLAVIDAAAMNLALDLKDGDPAALKRCRRIRSASEQLVELVRNCFQEDRLNLDERESRREPVVPEDLLREVHEVARTAGPLHRFEIEVQAGMAPVVCDPELTRLALRTLAINAVKYTPENALVRLRASSDAGGGVLLEVSDNGPGVGADELPHLMRRYYRGRNAQSIPGTGLGLSLAREMVERQGGRLSLHSVPGQGFTATVWLPRVAAG